MTSAAAATAARSYGSTIATATSANGSRTTSPAFSWSRQRSALDMKPKGRRMVEGTPDARTASSERIM